jgi:predicted nucleotidyltransferase
VAQIPEEINTKIHRFLDYLKQIGIHIDNAILFGSYAKGLQNKWSDIDLALVSKMFEGNRYNDLDKLTYACFAIDTNISPLPYNSEDFNPEDLFVKEIFKTGIRII